MDSWKNSALDHEFQWLPLLTAIIQVKIIEPNFPPL